MAYVINVPGAKSLTSDQVEQVTEAAQMLGIDPDWLFTVISFETGGTFSPKVRNAAGSGAFGLIQFMPSTAQNLLKTSTRDEAVAQGMAMSFKDQLFKMVVPYLRGPKLSSLEDVYLKIFWPAAIGKPDSLVIGDSNGTDFQKKVYTQNKGFDRDGKGYLTRGDVVRKIRTLYQNSGGIVEAQPAPSVVSSGGFWSAVFGVAVGAGMLWAAWSKTNALQGSFTFRKTPRPLPPLPVVQPVIDAIEKKVA